MLSKHSLEQDLHLLSPPTSYPSDLTNAFAETLNLELYHLPLTSETVSSDLKLRRELVEASTIFEKSPVVQAALSGGVLFLEGIHRAERNVLPVLNNLLENREINLDDGTSIISQKRYSEIKSLHGSRSDLIPCSPNFRIVASSLPWEVYDGQSLDPPLRSRMQCRRIDDYDAQEIFEVTGDKGVSSLGVGGEWWSGYDNFKGMKSEGENEDKSTKRKNNSNIIFFRRRLENFKSLHPLTYFTRGPFPESRAKDLLSKITLKKPSPPTQKITSTKTYTPISPFNTLIHKISSTNFHSLLIGKRGSGKSTITSYFNPNTTVQIYSDMSLRDLLQTRVTDELGNSSWKNSPVIEAAVNGETVALDGVEKMKSFNEFNTFWCEGNVQLPSGEVCKPLEEYERLKGEGVDVSKVRIFFKAQTFIVNQILTTTIEGFTSTP